MMKSPARRPNYIFVRGEYLRKGDEVTPGTPAALPPLKSDGEPDRLALARWLVSKDHPLTSRVAVNRLWQELFGRGIVATSCAANAPRIPSYSTGWPSSSRTMVGV